MRTPFTSVLLFFSLIAFSAKHDGFVIYGSIRGLPTGSVDLIYHTDSGDDTTITTPVVGEKFTLTGKVPEPELARINIRGGWSYSLSCYIENADMTLSIVKDEPEETLLQGSVSDMTYQRLLPQMRSFFSQGHDHDDAIAQAHARHDAEAVKKADALWAAHLQQWTDSIRASIMAHPKNYANLYFIQWLLPHPPPMNTIAELFALLDPTVRNSTAGKAFAAQLDHSRRISAGQPAPEIAGTDTNGSPEKLASLKGHIVLLDFWASYCAICRQQSPQLRALYERYHPAGFEILSVSLDYEKAAWTRAVQNDKMTWHQASELRGGSAASAKVYDVSDLPRNWLIDAAGNIIAHDLTISEIEDRLKAMTGTK